MSDPGSGLDASLTTAAQAFADFANGPVASTTATIENAVTRSFNSVSATIASAAKSGTNSIGQLTNSILADFNRIAASQFITKPIEGIVSSLAGSLLPVAGARANGGPVAAGSAYLVGEQGPELFAPQASGTIVPNGALASGAPASVTVNIQTQDAQSFLKSRSQVASLLTRALAQGQRNL